MSPFFRVGFVALVLGALGSLAIWLTPSWFPTSAAVQADRQDELYFWLMVMSAFIFAIVIVFLVYSMVKFRARPGDDSDGEPIHGHAGLEIIWTVLPIVIVLGFAIYGAAALGRNEALAKDRLIVDVQAQQFAWTFTYPSYGKLKTGILALPVGRQVEFHITAVEHDVLHSFYIPAFRLKQDAVPGVPQKLIATPTKLGTYMVTCAELCGIGHSQMRTVLHVLSPKDFTAWIADQKKAASQPAAGGSTDPAAIVSSDCASCHTFQPANATGTVGPDLDNLASDASKYGGGQSPEDYVKESIVDPDKVVVPGFPKGVMPTTFGTSLSADQIDALVQYLLKGGS
ncbi:MAG TPA: cytochrome c oxidase subunit II [Gaiellales bacterium]|nr:cytochrome c oxidase subunit II [Gaiellales bacterium]